MSINYMWQAEGIFTEVLVHLESMGKTIFIYFFLISIMRIMGKREMAQVSMFDVVVFFIISELLSLAINSRDSSLLDALIPISVIVILELVTSKVILKSHKMRKLVEGQPAFIIYQGQINQAEMKKQRYNVDDLMGELRANQVSSPSEVQFALLESKGKLSVITYKDSKVSFPEPLISDGRIVTSSLRAIKRDEEWLLEELKKAGYQKVDQVFLALWETGGVRFVAKDK